MTGTGGGRWGPRAVIKDIANKQRRANDKVETGHEPVEQLAAERRLRLADTC